MADTHWLGFDPGVLIMTLSPYANLAYEQLVLECQGPVLTCKLSNPPENTLTPKMEDELTDLLNRLRIDPGIRVLVVTGAAEGYFLKYFELSELDKVIDESVGAELPYPGENCPLTTHHEIGNMIETLPQVTIAAINGICGGGAVELSLCFDFRLMATGDPAFTYGSPQTTFGICPGGGAAVRYVRMLGTARALDLLLHGELMTPEVALAHGLVSRVYPKDEFRDRVREFAQNLAIRAPLGMQAVKRLVRRIPDLPLHHALRMEMIEFGRVAVTEDAQVALAAVMRDPEHFNLEKLSFKGR